MKRLNNNNKYLSFRKKYDFFEYQNYNYSVSDGYLIIEFSFNLSNIYIFKPKLEIELTELYSNYTLGPINIDNIVFHIGMIELISYWKLACPSRIIVNSNRLNEDQILWWKSLYYNGLGEFFYLNSIDASFDNFLSIESIGKILEPINTELDYESVIVPIGGGKDSVVSLELLSASPIVVLPMMVNPSAASLRTIENANYKVSDSLIVRRSLDPLILELNAEGFLNGHTPFSALLAFTNTLLSVLTGIGNIALSNENSANESTVPGTNINHQYSKSYEFEYDFTSYVKTYVHSGIKYFSFLRPLNELQIANLFSKFPQHFDSFRSCNVGSREDTWCGNCPKCLFTYIILSPFIRREELINIFGKNIFTDNSLKPILDELTGVSDVKPFECVGTIDEVNASIQYYLKTYSSFVNKEELLDSLSVSTNNQLTQLLSEFNEEHNLPNEFLQILKSALND